MSLGTIPPSIQKALELPSGYVMLVNGKPGSGKTILIQEIFRNFHKSFLVVSRMQTLSASLDGLATEIENWNDRHVLLDAHGPLFGSWAESGPLVAALSPFVNANKGLPKSDIVLIDSWSDMLGDLDPISRRKHERNIMQAAREEGKKLVIVVEDSHEIPAESELRHRADAIVTLEKCRADQKVYRRLTIEKMRSLPVNQDRFLFTLHEGRFTFIPWHEHIYPPIMVEREPIRDPSQGKISTGNKSLDALIGGGFQKGTLNLVEVGDLGAPYLETIYIPFLSNHLQLGRPAVVLLPEGWSSESFTEGLCHFVDKEPVSNLVVFFGRHILGTGTNVRAVDSDPTKTLQEMKYEAHQLEKKSGSEATQLFSLDTIENTYGPASARAMVAELSASLSGTGRVTVAILGRHQAMKAQSIPHDMHLRVRRLCGVLSISGVMPRTNFLALKPLLTEGFLDYELTPIV